MSRSLMGLDNVEWTASILDERNKPPVIKTKSKTELKAELAELIKKYDRKEVDADVVFNLIKYIYLHYPSKRSL